MYFHFNDYVTYIIHLACVQSHTVTHTTQGAHRKKLMMSRDKKRLNDKPGLKLYPAGKNRYF